MTEQEILDKISQLEAKLAEVQKMHELRAKQIQRLSTRNADLRQILDMFYASCTPVKMGAVSTVLGIYNSFISKSDDSPDDLADFHNIELLQHKLAEIKEAWDDVYSASTPMDYNFALTRFANIVYHATSNVNLVTTGEGGI